MRAREDPDIPGVIAGTFTLFDIDLYALINPGSTHSYICMEQMSNKFPSVESLAYDLLVTSPLGNSVRVNRVYKNCPLMVYDREILVNLIVRPEKILIFFKKGKMVILVKIRKISRSWMTKRTSPLESSHEI